VIRTCRGALLWGRHIGAGLWVVSMSTREDGTHTTKPPKKAPGQGRVPSRRSSNANSLSWRVSAELTTVITDISNTWLVPGYLSLSPLTPATESGLCVLELPNQAPVLAVSTLFSTSHNEKGELIRPTLNIVPLSDKLTAVPGANIQPPVPDTPYPWPQQIPRARASVTQLGLRGSASLMRTCTKRSGQRTTGTLHRIRTRGNASRV
jgi:hypothetical protein